MTPNDSRGALAFVNILGNHIPPDQAQELIKVMESKENLKTLCGFKGDEKELDLRNNKELGAGCAVLVSHEIQDMGALAFLTMHKYKLPVKEIKTAKELDLSYKVLNSLDAIVIAALIEVRTVNHSCCIH